ncbi:MAG: ABC transporter permease subunit [Oscillospiraceae bacterium]|nr:ABC transporter permease subunit [Oscillospiraceae bacterium]
MVLPGIALVFIFSYLPMFGVTLAFRDYQVAKGIWGSPWVGLKYFRQFVNDPFFFRIVRNTVLLNFYSLIFSFPMPVIFALLLNEIKVIKFKRVVQSLSYLPHFISTLVVVSIMMIMLDPYGIVNDFLSFIGLKEQIFFSDPKWFRTMYIGSGIWQHMGWESILYLAAVAGINPELYDAGVVDGANRFKQAIYITIPSILPVIRILLILNIGRMFSVGLEKVFLMYNPGIYETADVISTYVYRRGIEQMDYSFSSAVGLFNSTINFILLFLSNTVSKKISNEGLW